MKWNCYRFAINTLDSSSTTVTTKAVLEDSTVLDFVEASRSVLALCLVPEAF